ncbi:serine hydrolase domain-containing protein [Pseudoalteromonas sp. NBT06-2]|uniref:serine hydrolase domain-containing protein n=1 Tax=Pseudoalteromonas sp. NBT06-2 TaxID=2025950 RepID=UPI0014832617|nr:serine hydrolase domain-containing protein [Pseudoalteromonas sp. NBT06-2]
MPKVFLIPTESCILKWFGYILLVDDGKIELNKDIREYLPELNNYGVKVTVNSMLGHFSGMGDFDSLDMLTQSSLKSVSDGKLRLGNQDYISNDEFYDIIKKLPLKSNPDQKFEYSNFAYFLSSKLVEKQSGLTLRQFSDKRIFKPLGMKDTFFNDNYNEVILNRASGYKKLESGSYEINMTNLSWVGDGGLHTNIQDLAIWDNHFYQPKLGKNPKQLMIKMNTPNSKHTIDGWMYANGQFFKQLAEYKTFEHTGDWLGTSTFYARVPKNKVSVAVLCNGVDLNAAKYGIEALDIVHKHLANLGGIR